MKSEAYISNDKALAEINATLTQPTKRRGKIGIYLPTGAGDIMSAMSVLKYKDKLWPNKDVIWFCNMPNADLFKYGLVNEVRTYQWEGIEVDPFTQLRDSNNRLRQDRKNEFIEASDLEDAYFPAPWMYIPEERRSKHLPDISRQCFGISPDYEWHPCISFSNEELNKVFEVCSVLPFKKTVMLETVFNSGQSGWDDSLTRLSMAICRNHWGDCNFIFASKGDHSRFVDGDGIIDCNNFTLRQTALFNDYADIFIGVSSGVSVATSAWGLKPTPKIQYCNSFQCSTSVMANGVFELINPSKEHNKISDNNDKNSILKSIFVDKLTKLLKTIDI